MVGLSFNQKISIIILIWISCFSQAQNPNLKDSIPYQSFKNRFVFYTGFGYSSAPFSIKYHFPKGIEKLNYRNNYRNIWTIGLSFKWFSLRIGIPLPGNARPVSKFGTTKPFNIGFDFSIQKNYFEVNYRNYLGYSLLDAYRWVDSLDQSKPNTILKKMNAVSFSVNSWYFHNKNFKMSAVKGTTAHFEKEVHTWYLKGVMQVFGVGNDKQGIVPNELSDSNSLRISARLYSAFDLGILPGYAYANKINNWQFAIMGGLGLALQTKFYSTDQTHRGFLGLAPRYDIKLVGGYSQPKYFIFLSTNFDNKSIRFDNLAYRQYFYSIHLIGGIRLKNGKKNKGL